jgi:PAS domain S-box-containing protein
MSQAHRDELHARLAAILDFSDDAIVGQDLNGLITSWNRGAERIFGYDSAEAIGQPIALLIPADLQTEEAHHIHRAHHGEAVLHRNTALLRRNGDTVPISLTLLPTRAPDGAILGVLLIAEDLTHRLQAQRDALRLAAIVSSSDDAILSKDLNGIVMSWNRAAERVFGYSAEEIIGRSIRLIVPKDRQREEDDVLARARRGLPVHQINTTRRHKNGRLIPISLTVSPIRDAGGTVVGASTIARDITAQLAIEAERARLLELAREQAAITERLNEVGTLVASTLDRDAIVQAVTDAATELTAAEFGAFFYNHVDPASGEAYLLYTLAGATKEAFANFPNPRATAVFGPTFRGEGPVRIADVTQDPRYGKNAPYHGMPTGHLPVRSYLAVPVKTRSGDVLGGLFFGHSGVDVFTEQHERLALGIATWASVALENARLYVGVQEASRLKDEFLATLSHELRTPLNAILGYTRMVRSGLLVNDKRDHAMEVIERNSVALAQIVEDVLDVSRIIAGKIRLNVQPVELPKVIREALDTVRPAAEAKGVRLETIIDPRAAPVSGDPDRLQQVVWNLLSNAVKFTPRGGRVQARLERVNSHIEVVVSDTGIGIATEFLPHVFERFRQADAGFTREHPGLGLGLAIARQVVEMHGGTIHAASGGAGQGATFRLQLPMMIVHAETHEEQRVHPHTHSRHNSVTVPNLEGVRVLAVDDDRDALALVREILEVTGAQVSTAYSADTAMAVIESERPHVLLADLGMPQVDGFELIAKVRALADLDLRHTPAAALTAYARSEDRVKALRSGFQLHLAKPVEPGELMAAIAALARRPRAGA